MTPEEALDVLQQLGVWCADGGTSDAPVRMHEIRAALAALDGKRLCDEVQTIEAVAQMFEVEGPVVWPNYIDIAKRIRAYSAFLRDNGGDQP